MTRSAFRRLWMITIGLLLIGAYMAFNKAQSLQGDMALAEENRIQLNRDLRAGNLLSAALADLDNFTINENRATTLDILRYLDLAETSMQYNTSSITTRQVGQTRLYIRDFALKANMSFAECMTQADWLHNTNKVVLRHIQMKPANGYGDVADMQIEGVLYGLDK